MQTQDKAFFDWLREQQTNKRLTQKMVDGANELLALMGHDELKAALSKINGWDTAKPAVMSFSDAGMKMLAEFEGFRSKPYLDAVGVPTIGYGTTYYIGADGSRKSVSMHDKAIDVAEALRIKKDVINADFASAINLMFADEIKTGYIKQAMFDALVSLAYNIGVRGLKGSSVYRHIKAGNKLAAANSFLAWNKGRIKGQLVELKGLTTRRAKERDLFLS